MSILIEKFKALPAERKALCLFIPIFLLAMLFAWYTPTPKPPGKVFDQAPTIQGTDVPKVDATIKSGKIKVIPKAAIKKTIKPFPKELEDPDEEATATAEIAPSENGTKVISITNLTTGDTRILQKENAPPLFAWENKKRIGAGYGYSNEGSTVKVFGEYTFVRIGSFHVGTQVELNATTLQAPQAKALAIIDYRW